MLLLNWLNAFNLVLGWIEPNVFFAVHQRWWTVQSKSSQMGIMWHPTSCTLEPFVDFMHHEMEKSCTIIAYNNFIAYNCQHEVIFETQNDAHDIPMARYNLTTF